MKSGHSRYHDRGRHRDEQAGPEGMEEVDVEIRRLGSG